MRNIDRNITSFIKKQQIIIISIGLALFSLHLALTDKREMARGTLARSIFSVTVTPVQGMMLAIKGGVISVWSDYVNLIGVKTENEALRKTVLALEQENNRLTEEMNLNARLRELLQYKESAGFSTTSASITAFNTDLWTRTVTIDKGLDDGIRKDFSVISPSGVVGRVIDSDGSTSTVLLATDARSNIDAVIQRSRVKGVIEGNGADGLGLKYIRQIDDVQAGDVIVTSGLSGIFPKGIVIGEVTKVEKGTDNFFKYIEVRPSSDIRKIEEVLVVTGKGAQDGTGGPR